MCYPKPGPRCSAHAKHRLDVATQAVTDATWELQKAKKAHPADWPPYHPDVQKAESAVRSARFDAEEARQQFLQTPDGIRSLERELSKERWKTADGWGSEPSGPSLASEERIAALESQIGRMKVHRARQLNAYRASKGLPEVPSDEWSYRAEEMTHEEQSHPELRTNPCPECDEGEIVSGEMERETGYYPSGCNSCGAAA